MSADIDELLPDSAVNLDIAAKDWRDAICTPVKFGNTANDPVSLVIGLAGHDENEHIGVMSAVAAALSNPVKTRELAQAKNAKEIRAILKS